MNVAVHSAQEHTLRGPQGEQLYEYCTKVFPPLNIALKVFPLNICRTHQP